MNTLTLFISSLFLAALDLSPILNPIMDAFNTWLFPVLMVVLSIIGIPTIVSKGIKLAKSEDENQKLAAQKGLITAIVAFVLIFVLILAFNLMLPILKDWVETVG